MVLAGAHSVCRRNKCPAGALVTHRGSLGASEHSSTVRVDLRQACALLKAIQAVPSVLRWLAPALVLARDERVGDAPVNVRRDWVLAPQARCPSAGRYRWQGGDVGGYSWLVCLRGALAMPSLNGAQDRLDAALR